LGNIVKQKGKFTIFEKHDEVIYILVNGQVMVADGEVISIKGNFVESEYIIDEKGNYIFDFNELENNEKVNKETVVVKK